MPARRHYVDWLRVSAMLVLVAAHAAVIFMPGQWYVSNREKSAVLSAFVMFAYQWYIPLFFVLAGMSSFHALEVRTSRQYVIERFKRLFVPLVFGTLVLIPPIVYAKEYAAASDPESFWHFYPRFFDAPYPKGNFQWAHLWFLTYLLAHSLLALPIFLWLRTDKGARLISRLAALCGKRGGIHVLAIPFALIEAGLRPIWSGALQNLYNDWANFFSFFLCFIYGFIFVADERFEGALTRRLWLSAALAVALMLVCFGLYSGLSWPVHGYSAKSLLLHLLRGCHIWFWVVLFLGLGRRYLNRANRVLEYAREAAYPFYILHLTVLVWIAFFVTKWRVGIPIKFTIMTVGATFATLSVYDCLVRRWAVARFLFGMRPKG